MNKGIEKETQLQTTTHIDKNKNTQEHKNLKPYQN